MARQRVCDLAGCEVSLEGMHQSRRFCSDAHRKAAKRAPKTTVPTGRVSTEIADRYRQEFASLGVLDTGEAHVALGIAVQLDDKVVQGAAYVSLSKELDRRVDALRLKGVQKDDPLTTIQTRVEAKQHLKAV